MTTKNLVNLFIASIILSLLPVSSRGESPATPTAPTAGKAFAIRGIKGLWWDGMEKYRLALPWVASHDMNFLMFCYTSFPASGMNWRSEYTSDELAGFRELSQRADTLKVELCLSFNPGIWSKPPLTYASESDYQLAWKKVQTVHAAGIHSFALCLDDINKKLEPTDAERFKTLEAAQVYFTNRLWADMKTLSPRPRLIFCPSAYTSSEAEKHIDYIKKIADLDPDIFVFWTGATTCASTITAKDAEQFASWVGRKPIVWDNYPVNDMFPWRPLLAPVKGRSADLGGAVVGVMANPMKQWNASTIPLATLAMYLNDPAGYEPAAAKAKLIASFPVDQQPVIELLMSVYGTTFLGEKAYPPNAKTEPTEAGATLARCKQLREQLSHAKGLEGLWMDVQPTLDADIAAMEKTGK